MASNVLTDTDFVCNHFRQCRASHRGTYYQGQMHHLGRYYDLFAGRVPLRIAVVGQEYGAGPACVNMQMRYHMIMHSGLYCRFKADNSHPARNPHMRGTTSLLRLLLDVPLGAAHQDEFLNLSPSDKCHLFECFALVNYLICSAHPQAGQATGRSTSTMRSNCLTHFRKALEILEPTVVVMQGTNYWQSVRDAFDNMRRETDNIYKAKVASSDVLVAVFTHPSAHPPNNWGWNEKTPYLLRVVAPTITRLRSVLGLYPNSNEHASA